MPWDDLLTDRLARLFRDHGCVRTVVVDPDLRRRWPTCWPERPASPRPPGASFAPRDGRDDQCARAARRAAGDLGRCRRPAAGRAAVAARWWRSVLVPLTVLAPLVALAPTADHRFNIYWHGGHVPRRPAADRPAHPAVAAGTTCGMGNFRPLGRMLEKSLDLVAYALTDLLGLPANVSFRLVSFLGAIVLTVVAVLLAESVVARGRLFRRPPSTLAATVPFAVGGGFVAAGSASPAVLFGGLYLLSAALVLGVAARGRAGSARSAGSAGGARSCCWSRAPRWPAFNEIAYLALPLATAAVLLRGRWCCGLAGAGC